MDPQTSSTPLPVASPAMGAAHLQTAAGQPKRIAVPTPSLKPGEVITWIKFERPRLPIGEILASSFTMVGLVILIAVTIGMFLGHLKSKRSGTHGTGGLGLR